MYKAKFNQYWLILCVIHIMTHNYIVYQLKMFQISKNADESATWLYFELDISVLWIALAVSKTQLSEKQRRKHLQWLIIQLSNTYLVKTSIEPILIQFDSISWVNFLCERCGAWDITPLLVCTIYIMNIFNHIQSHSKQIFFITQMNQIISIQSI